jgi:hypothetical protein
MCGRVVVIGAQRARLGRRDARHKKVTKGPLFWAEHAVDLASSLSQKHRGTEFACASDVMARNASARNGSNQATQKREGVAKRSFYDFRRQGLGITWRTLETRKLARLRLDEPTE